MPDEGVSQAEPTNLIPKEIYVDAHGREIEPEYAAKIIVLWCTPSGSVVRRQEFISEEFDPLGICDHHEGERR